MAFPFLKPKPKAPPARPRSNASSLPTVMVGSVGAAVPRNASDSDDATKALIYKKLRRSPTQTELRVGDTAMAWLISLPKDLRPVQCCQRYPHVVNHLAGWWDNAEGLTAYFDDLRNGSRKQRAGFPAPVKSEIEALYAHAQGVGLLSPGPGAAQVGTVSKS